MSNASTEATPNAATLDDVTLRRVFARAPQDTTVPRDVKTIFKARVAALGGNRRALLLAATFGLPLLGVAIGLAFTWILGGAIIGAVILTVIIVLSLQYSRAKVAFFDMYATARGLTHDEDSTVRAAVPLFSKGDKRKWSRVLSGTIAGQDASLGHYTYTDVSTDSEGNRSETDYDFTFLKFDLPAEVAARFVGVYCSPKGISFGALQDKLAHDRAVSLESGEFHRRYALRVVDAQDDIALFELFSPPFIQELVEGSTSFWEQRGADLVFWKKGHEQEAADLDRFCLDSQRVLNRYLEEYR